MLDRAALRGAIRSREMERLYKIDQRRDATPDPGACSNRPEQELVKLQAGDAENLAHLAGDDPAFRKRSSTTIYGRLGVKFDHTLGESFYNPRLKTVVQELRDKGIARESEGAVAVFSDGSLPPKEDPFLQAGRRRMDSRTRASIQKERRRRSITPPPISPRSLTAWRPGRRTRSFT